MQLHLLLTALLPRLQQEEEENGFLLGFCLFRSQLQPELLKAAIELVWNYTPVPQRPQLYRSLLQHCSSSAAVGAMCAAFEPCPVCPLLVLIRALIRGYCYSEGTTLATFDSHRNRKDWPETCIYTRERSSTSQNRNRTRIP